MLLPYKLIERCVNDSKYEVEALVDKTNIKSDALVGTISTSVR